MRDYSGQTVAPIRDPVTRAILAKIDFYLRDLSRGIGRIQQGQTPDGSGNPIPIDTDSPTLDDYLFLPGRIGGQEVEGLDANPTVTIDSGATGLTVNGSIGNPIFRLESANSPILDFRPYQFDATIEVALTDSAGVGIGVNFPSNDGTSAFRIASTTNRTFLQCGLKNSTGNIDQPNMTIGATGARVADSLATEILRINLANAGTVNGAGGAISANTTRVGINRRPDDYRNSSSATQPSALILKSVSNSTTDPACLILESFSSTQPLLEVRGASSGSTPTAQVGTLNWQVDGAGDIKWFTTGSRRGRITPIVSGTGSGGLTFSNSADRLSFETLPETGAFADSVSSLYIRAANTATEVNRLMLASQGTAAFSRLGIIATSTILGPAPTGLMPAPVSGRILTLVDSGGTVLSGFDSAGAHFHIAGATAGDVWTSDANGTGSWAAPAGGGTVFADDVFRIEDNGDPTKELAFEVSPISSGQTRTVTVQNSSGTMALLEANQTFTGALNFPPDSVADPPIFHCDDTQASFPSDNFATIRDNASGLDYYMRLLGDVSAGIQSLEFPAAGGTVVTSDAAQTLDLKEMTTSTVLKSFTAAVGASFSDNTTATKRLRMILSGAVGNNSIVISSTAARQYTFPNATGNVPIVGNDPPAVAAGALGIVDTTALAAAVGATNLTNGAAVGVYVIHYEMTCTTGDATAGTITFDITCTGDQGAQTISSAALPLTTATASATNPVRGTLVRYLASGELSYAVAVTGAFNNARAAVRARIVYMG